MSDEELAKWLQNEYSNGNQTPRLVMAWCVEGLACLLMHHLNHAFRYSISDITYTCALTIEVWQCMTAVVLLPHAGQTQCRIAAASTPHAMTLTKLRPAAVALPINPVGTLWTRV